MIDKQKAIDNIVENFKWEKVHKAMKALGWTWYDSEGETPSVGALFKCAVGLLHEAYDGAERFGANYNAGTGGFYARAFVDDETKEVIQLRLSFEICNWEYYDELPD